MLAYTYGVSAETALLELHHYRIKMEDELLHLRSHCLGNIPILQGKLRASANGSCGDGFCETVVSNLVSLPGVGRDDVEDHDDDDDVVVMMKKMTVI